MGEQADYEIDRLTGEPHADFGSRWSDFWLPAEPPPLRKGRAAPELVPANPLAFDDLTAPVLEAVAPRQMELLEWPGV